MFAFVFLRRKKNLQFFVEFSSLIEPFLCFFFKICEWTKNSFTLSGVDQRFNLTYPFFLKKTFFLTRIVLLKINALIEHLLCSFFARRGFLCFLLN